MGLSMNTITIGDDDHSHPHTHKVFLLSNYILLGAASSCIFLTLFTSLRRPPLRRQLPTSANINPTPTRQPSSPINPTTTIAAVISSPPPPVWVVFTSLRRPPLRRQLPTSANINPTTTPPNAASKSGSPLSDTDVSNFCNQTTIYHLGMDVTKAELISRTNWRRQEKIENVGEWKARVYILIGARLRFWGFYGAARWTQGEGLNSQTCGGQNAIFTISCPIQTNGIPNNTASFELSVISLRVLVLEKKVPFFSFVWSADFSMVGIFSRLANLRRTQSALDVKDVAEATHSSTTIASTESNNSNHGIEIVVGFKPIEHPTEPLDNDQPIPYPLPDPSILNDGRIWKERVSSSVQTRADMAVVQEEASIEPETQRAKPPRPCNRVILPSVSAPEHSILKLLEECNASDISFHS
ncbi:hypothetical protein CASFOL_036725 [Castilleja foliolosa]|uniref:Ankyrin repeat domain-containing protein n=1 Tax=Castilleja foliolosa TaxID=1961234 RepID=A0ABD3BNV8_9LAMI